MTKISKRSDKILKNIKPLQEDLQKRRARMEKKKQETDRISFIKNEINRYANENDAKCLLFIEFQKEIANEAKSKPQKELLLTDAIDLFSQICKAYPEIEAAFFEARGAEGLAQSFELLLNTAVSELLQQMFSNDFSIVFKNLLNTENKNKPEPEDPPTP